MNIDKILLQGKIISKKIVKETLGQHAIERLATKLNNTSRKKLKEEANEQNN